MFFFNLIVGNLCTYSQFTSLTISESMFVLDEFDISLSQKMILNNFFMYFKTGNK